MTPVQVAAAASQLAVLTEDDLIRRADPQELNRAEIYPGRMGNTRRTGVGGPSPAERSKLLRRIRRRWRRGDLAA
ncbi:DUF1877 family protein [Plantactinospora sp. KBS50]|uniref:DUF1877 family protein n=1 Tax=Plantactinospora sp. KBS50 TaxID=2024580 RepID=UPI001E398736|nr:DUF1877 family protein [Plantactinospora sp. KBS50]